MTERGKGGYMGGLVGGKGTGTWCNYNLTNERNNQKVHLWFCLCFICHNKPLGYLQKVLVNMRCQGIREEWEEETKGGMESEEWGRERDRGKECRRGWLRELFQPWLSVANCAFCQMVLNLSHTRTGGDWDEETYDVKGRKVWMIVVSFQDTMEGRKHLWKRHGIKTQRLEYAICANVGIVD